MNDEGAKRFSDLTGQNLRKPLAIVLGDKITEAPIVQSRITKSGTIDGGSTGFTQQEINLVKTLNSPPNIKK